MTTQQIRAMRLNCRAAMAIRIMAKQDANPSYGAAMLSGLADSELRSLERETGVDLDAIAEYGRGIGRMRKERG